MKIDNEFTVGVPIDTAWNALTDLAGIAPCMPGAQLTGVEGDVYSGRVKIKVGPVISQYAGTAQFVERDDAAYRAVIRAKGKDSRGAGNASALIDARLRAEGASTVVTVATDLNISGKIAQFGSGMIKEVSVKLLGQFAQNLEAQLHSPATGVAASGPAAANAGPDTANAGPGPANVGPGPDTVAVAGGTETGPGTEAAAGTEALSTPPAAAGAGARPAPETDSAGTAVPGPVVTGSGAAAGAPAGLGDNAIGPDAPSEPGPSAAAPFRPATSGGADGGADGVSGEAGGEPQGASSDAAADGLGTRPMSTARRADAAEPIDLMSLAGNSLYKRLIPVVAAVLVIAALIVYFVVR